MALVKTIGIPGDRMHRPFADAIRAHPGLKESVAAPAVLARDLEARILDAAFLSPIDFARNASEYLIVPGTGIFSSHPNNAVAVRFRPGLRSIQTLAVPPVSVSDIVLARILLAERYDLSPRIVPVAGSLDEMLAKADAALLAGDDALRAAATAPAALDLVEEWIVLTGLPYVHSFCVAREGGLLPSEWSNLADAGNNAAPGKEHVEEDAASGAMLQYGLPEDAREGVREFLRYAFYHGILPDVPDLRFFGEDDVASGDPILN
jgi:chorismate dehydratase